MNFKHLFIAGVLTLAACQSGEQVGYVRLALPSFQSLAESPGATAVFEESSLNSWTITVTGEDMDEPVVVTTTDTEVTVQVKPGPQRLVHVSARAPEVNGVAQGYDGETIVDVPEQGNAEAVVDVYRSVTVSDANAPINRNGEAAAATAPDVASLTLTLGADALHLFFTFANDVAAPWNVRDNSIRGLIDFDLDRNAQTGDSSLVQARSQRLRKETATDAPIGAELTVDLSPASQGFVRLVSNQTSKPISAAFGAKVLSVAVPYADLGGQPQAFRLAAMILDTVGSSDFLPEKDYLEIAIQTTPAPTGEIPVSEFQRTSLGSVAAEVDYWQDYFYPPAVALVRGNGGLHAAWTKAGSVEYAFSEDGKSFPVRRTLQAKPHYSFIDLTVDASGNPLLAITTQYYSSSESPESQTHLYWGKGSDLGVPVVTDTVYDFVEGSQVAVSGNGAYVMLRKEYNAPELVRVSGGTIAASAAPELQGSYQDYTLINGKSSVLLAAWEPYGVGMQLFSVSEALGLTATSSAGTPAENSFIDVFSVAGDDVVYAAYGDWSNGIYVSGTDGSQYQVSGADAYPTYEKRELAQPQVAVSASGRIGVVWYSIPGFVGEAAPPLRLSRMMGDGSGLQGFYYAELLPKAKEFSAPVFVGDGDQVALAFDGVGLPVVLVGASVFDGQGQATSQAEVYIYNGR